MNETPSSADHGTFEVTEDASAGRFELRRGGELVSFANYVAGDGVVRVPFVGTNPQDRGNGYAAHLMDGLLEIIRSDGRKIVPICSFADQHVRGNPEYHDLLSG